MSSVTTKTHGVRDVRSVWVWYGHTTTFLCGYFRHNTQGDSTVPTESKNVCARDTKQRPEVQRQNKNAKVLT